MSGPYVALISAVAATIVTIAVAIFSQPLHIIPKRRSAAISIYTVMIGRALHRRNGLVKLMTIEPAAV